MSVYERATNAVLPEERFDVKINKHIFVYIYIESIYKTNFLIFRCLIYI